MNTDDFFPATAAATIPARTIAKFTATRNEVAPATAATDPLAGVVDLETAAGGLADVAYGGVFEVKAGGNIAAGDPLTADANGCAVKAVAVAGQTVRVIGFARTPAVAGDLFDYVAAPSVIVG